MLDVKHFLEEINNIQEMIFDLFFHFNQIHKLILKSLEPLKDVKSTKKISLAFLNS